MIIPPLPMYLTEMKGKEPILPKNCKQMKIDVLHFKKSTLNPEGIKFFKNNYNNDGQTKYLAKIRANEQGKKKKVFWRYDPEDIREIWVYNEWVENPFYFSVNFSTGLLKLFIQEYPNIPIPLRSYNNVRRKLR